MSCTHASSKPDEELRLRDEHAFLERRLAEAIALAEADNWAGFESKWSAFMEALAEHTRHEDSLLLPSFARSGPASSQAAEQLRAEHRSLAKDVEVLDRESQQPEFFIEQLRHLRQNLQTHRQKEERILYPGLPALHALHPSQSLSSGELTTKLDS